MKRLLAAASVIIGSVVVWQQPAGALPILDTADAQELAEVLAEATEEQGICYGWRVEVIDQGGGGGFVDEGSNRGVGESATVRPCTRYMVFYADLTYTAESSEASEYGEFGITSNIPGAPDRRDLERLGITESRLLGANDDLAVAEATRALPLLAAEAGLAEPLPLDLNTEALPEGDAPTGSHGSDWRRTYGAPIVFGVVLVLLGVGAIALTILNPNLFAPTKEPFDDR